MQRIMSAMSKGKKRSFDKIITKTVPRPQKLEKPLLDDNCLEPGSASITFYDAETKSVWDFVTHASDTLEELRDVFGLRMSPSEIDNIKTHYPGDKPKQVDFLLQKWALNHPRGTPTIRTILESLWFADREATVKDICTMLRSTEASTTRKGGIIAAKLSMEAQGTPTTCTCTSPSGELVGTSPIATESLASGMLVHGTTVQRQESSKSNDHFTPGPVPFHANAPASVLAAPIQDSESGNIDQLVRAHREHEDKLLVVEQRVARLETEQDEAGKREDEDRVRHSENEKDLRARLEKLEWRNQGVQSLKKPTACACLEGVDSGSSNDNIYEKIDSPPSTKQNPPPLPPRWPQGAFHHSTPTLEAWTESPPLPPRNPHTLKLKHRSFPVYTQSPPHVSQLRPGSVLRQYQPLSQQKSIYHDPLHRSASDPIFQSNYEVPITQNDDDEDEDEGLTLFIQHRRSKSEKPNRESRRSLRREPTPERIDRGHLVEHRLAEQK